MNPLRKLTSALSTAHALVLSAIELPDALRDLSSGLEWRKWAREFTEVDCVDEDMIRSAISEVFRYSKTVLEEANERCIDLRCGIKTREAERDCLRTSLAISTNERASAVSEYEKAIEMVKLTGAVYDEAVKERDALRAKLEDLERWRQVTSGEGELPAIGQVIIIRAHETAAVFVVKATDSNGPGSAFQWRPFSSGDSQEETRNNGQAL